ncbi:MAG TPA: S8 family serine peptidase, partial [Pyrinomonadaceae bacterium]
MPTQEAIQNPTIEETAAQVALGDVCHVCGRWTRGESIALADLPADVAQLIRANSPSTKNLTEACGRCARLFTRAKDQIIADAALNKDGSHVLSTPLRLDADERFTGKRVTIAFLDSGFYPHVDLTTPHNRIIAYHNLTDADGDVSSLLNPDVASWHGMMTSVVAAGNGSLSNGFYRGIAPDANVALVKLARTGRISDQNIFDGLEWVLENRERFDIRVVNISAGGDAVASYLHDPLSQIVEECSRVGITIVCAVGNAGHLDDHPVFPPASSPSAISVGGLDDQNSLNRAKRGMYRSSYGPTVDGLQKPE